jgi:hypothetical protein
MLDKHTGLQNLVVKVQIALVDHCANLRLSAITPHKLAEHNAQHYSRSQDERKDDSIFCIFIHYNSLDKTSSLQ